jgi:hypothetical protein
VGGEEKLRPLKKLAPPKMPPQRIVFPFVVIVFVASSDLPGEQRLKAGKESLNLRYLDVPRLHDTNGNT